MSLDRAEEFICITTPHLHHFQHAKPCHQAGEHVLYENAVTLNVAEAEILAKTAKEKSVFLMEAVWTGFFPVSGAIKTNIESGAIEPVYRVIADMSFGEDVEKIWDTTDCVVNLDLAGGTLLDRTFVPSQCLLDSLDEPNKCTTKLITNRAKWAFTIKSCPTRSASLLSQCHPLPNTLMDADKMVFMVLSFPVAPGSPQTTHGVTLTKFHVASDPHGHNYTKPAIHMQRSKRRIRG